MNIGDRAGDYEVVAILGAGGMGQVCKVRNVLSERIEAMKVLHPNLEGDPDLADRFLREIKVQATLDHPNIAKLHTAFRHDNQLVMVMEFVDGESIEKLLATGPLSVDDAIRYTGQVLDALAYAHARGVIHRDIKPANIMRTAPGAVKLLDFGIARLKDDSRLTQTGRAVGTLAYMSPEQIRGGTPDSRSDLYALGVTLYEMVTGRRPFVADSDYAIMSAHLEKTPSAPIEIVPGLPGGLSDIILIAMAKDSAARFQTAEAMHAALRNLGAPTVSSTPAVTRTMITPIMAPPPLPVAAAPPPAPLPLPPAPAKSRRGLYMALGSLATLCVLAFAIIEGPKYLRVGASPSTPSPSPAVSTAPKPAPVVVPAPALAPTPAPPVETVQTPPANPAPALRPAPVQEVRQKSIPLNTPAPESPPQQPPPQPPPRAQAQSPDRAQLNELREQYNNLSIRAGSAKSGLQSIEQQMQRQGLGLRGDMKEAQLRVEYQMHEAMESIRSGDIEGAKQHLEMADRALDTITKFLGR